MFLLYFFLLYEHILAKLVNISQVEKKSVNNLRDSVCDKSFEINGQFKGLTSLIRP